MLHGVDAVPVTVEARMRSETGSARILGLVGTSVREAYHRILEAFSAQELPSPRGVPTINLWPAALPKQGTGFDLPMALALAAADAIVPPGRCEGLAAFGELSLQGRVLPATGAVSVALAARDAGWHTLLANPAAARAAAMVPGIRVLAVDSLREAVMVLRGESAAREAEPLPWRSPEPIGDLADVRGHETPKTALAIAAAGRHNLLFMGPPGSGKTALLQRLPGLMPPLQQGEALDVLKIHTAFGTPAETIAAAGPLRAPHHSSSTTSLLGGGMPIRPGEVTLAQHGVLFLDELPEFRREALEGLRQPLEDLRVTIGRAAYTVTMPADFLLVAAMNPCPCGWAGHPLRACACGPARRRAYGQRLSGPLLDRLDVQLEVPALDPASFRAMPDSRWSTAALRARVLVAVERQRERNRFPGAAGYVPNGRLPLRALEKRSPLSVRVQDTLEEVLRAYRLSGRARLRLLRVARTLADLDDRADVTADDVMEAGLLRCASPTSSSA
jgi:magnesium chelatase family protein